jgi:hypothetical protein
MYDDSLLIEENNYVKGALGALVGALIAAIPWAIALYFGWFVGWLGLLIAFGAKKGYELMGGKKGWFKICTIGVACILGVLVGNTAWDIIEFALLISSGDIFASYWDIPELYFEWVQIPEVSRFVFANLGLGFLFAIIGMVSVFKEMFSEMKAAPSDETNEL